MKKYKFVFLFGLLSLFFALMPSIIVLAQVPPPLFITTISLPTATFGYQASTTLEASGGVPPYTWSATNLPNGVSIDPLNGVLSGVPATTNIIAPATTTFTPTIQVQDSVGQTASATFSWDIITSFSFTRTPSSHFVTGPVTIHIHGIFKKDFCPDADGYNFYLLTFTDPEHVQVFGHAPGDIVDDTLTQTLAPDSYTPRLACSGQNQYVDLGDGFVVPSVPAISSSSILPPGIVGQSYSTTLQVNAPVPAAPYTWSVTGGTLPDGLSLDSSSGVISGVPITATTSTFTIQVQDAVGQTGIQVVIMYVFRPIAITTTFLPSTTVGANYSQTLAVADAVVPLSWFIVEGILPNGLNLDASTGQISGVSTTAGTSNFTVQVNDANSQVATKALTLVVNSPLIITTTFLPQDTVGVAYSQTIQATGGTLPLTWSVISGNLPFGLSLNALTGEITGTPSTATSTTFVVQVQDASFVITSRQFTLIINHQPNITRPELPNGKVGRNYSQYVAVSGGTIPLTWSITNGSLPTDFSLDSSTGIISGVPIAAGVSIFIVTVQDVYGVNDSKSYSITVNP